MRRDYRDAQALARRRLSSLARSALAEGTQEGAHGVGRGSQTSSSSGWSPSIIDHLQIGIDQRQELARGDVGIVDVEKPAWARRAKRAASAAQVLPGTLFAPVGEEFGIALAFGLDQLAQEFSVAVADAVRGSAASAKAIEVRLEVLRAGRERWRACRRGRHWCAR